MARIQFLVGLLALALAVGCKAQSPAQTPESALNHEIAVIVRAQLSLAEGTHVAIGARKPSQIPGYDSLPVTLTNGTRSQVEDFLISTDNQTLARLDSYNLAHYPLIEVAGRPRRGNPAAPVTVVSFDDLECPYCAIMHKTLFPATLDRYKDKVRFIYRDNPLAEIHPWAVHAAVDANCLGTQNNETYWTYVDYVHAHGQEINGEDHDNAKSFAALDRIARQEATLSKLDLGKVEACIGKQDETQVRASMKEADSLQVEGAPALFVDGARISGALPQEQVWAVIDRALRDAGVEPPAAPAQSLPSPPAGIGK